MEQEFTLKNPMSPLWIMYPNIPQFSIGWRTGNGEAYKWNLDKWLQTLSPKEKAAYVRMFPRPKFWHNDFEENYYELIPFWEKNGKKKYYIEKLIKQEKHAEPEYIFFWKPNPDCKGKSYLGQWQPSKFKVETTEYTSAEQYMMAEKARLFEDDDIEEQIMQAFDPKKIKALGQKVKNFDQTVWDKVKYSVVLNGNYYKFSQNREMRDFLLATGDKILVEASPLDIIWGSGLGEKDPNAPNPLAWRGKNLLGFALMEVRDELRRLYKNYHKIDWERLERYSLQPNKSIT